MSSTERKSRRNWLGGLIVTVCILAVLVTIGRSAGSLEVERFAWPYLGRAALMLSSAYLLRALAYGLVVRTLDPLAPILVSAGVFLISQLGRYIPGKIWAVAGAGYFGAKRGIAPQAGAIVSAYFMLLHSAVGALLGMWVASRLVLSGQPWLTTSLMLLLAVAVIAFASSPLMPASLRWLGRKMGRELQVVPIPLLAVLLSVLTSFFVWTLFGAAVVDVFRAVLPDQSPPDLVTATAAMAAASIAGLAVIVAPSGLGVREAVFVGVFAGTYTAAGAGVVAIVLRILMSALELGLALFGLAFGRARLRGG